MDGWKPPIAPALVQGSTVLGWHEIMVQPSSSFQTTDWWLSFIQLSSHRVWNAALTSRDLEGYLSFSAVSKTTQPTAGAPRCYRFPFLSWAPRVLTLLSLYAKQVIPKSAYPAHWCCPGERAPWWHWDGTIQANTCSWLQVYLLGNNRPQIPLLQTCIMSTVVIH